MRLGSPSWRAQREGTAARLARSRQQRRIRRSWIVDHDLALELNREAARQDLVAVELPVRIVAGVEQDLVRPQMVDHAGDLVAGVRRVERLDGHAEMVAKDLRRRA